MKKCVKAGTNIVPATSVPRWIERRSFTLVKVSPVMGFLMRNEPVISIEVLLVKKRMSKA